jgi:uncharacterized protein (DUF1499 family)
MRLSLGASGVAVASLVLLGLAGPAYRLGLPLGTAFSLVRWASYAALLGAALAVGAVLWARRKSAKGRGAAIAVATLGLIVGVLTAAGGYGWLRQAERAPLLHDVTTDFENPPLFQAVVPLRASAANLLTRTREVDQLQRQHYADLAPATVAQPPRLVFDRAHLIAENQGWQIVKADVDAGRIEATDTTVWFGLTDDIVVRLTPWGTGTRVDVRSVSREGTSDLGTNARRIRRFLSALQAP